MLAFIHSFGERNFFFYSIDRRLNVFVQIYKYCNTFFWCSSKFNPERVTYTTADEIDVNDPLNIQLTTSGTRYIFPMSGRLSDKTQSSSVDGGEDESDSTSEDCESDPEIHNIDTTPVDRTNIFPKVVFFGTGSSFPGVTKSVTAILVHTT